MKVATKALTRWSILFLAFLTPLMWTFSSPAQAGEGYIRKVRTIYTAKLGLEHPLGLTFSSKVDAFFTMETLNGNLSRLFMITPHREVLGTADIDIGNIDPVNLVCDDRHSRLLAFETGTSELLELESLAQTQSASSFRIKTRFPAARLGMQFVQGLAMDSGTGDLFALDSAGKNVVRIKPAANGDLDIAAAVKARRTTSLSLSWAPSGELRGLAFNPSNGHLYLLSPGGPKIFEFTPAGELVAEMDLKPFNLRDPRGIVFAPSGDPTDDPANYSLYVTDAGSKANSARSAAAATGQIAEFSFDAPIGLDATTAVIPATLIRTTLTSQFSPPAPDPAGVTYLPDTNTLLISDSEVDEMSLFTGTNLWETTLTGTPIRTRTTLTWSYEPTGVSVDPVSGKWFLSDDDSYRINIWDPGPDRTFDTADDRHTLFKTRYFNSYDPEDVAFDRQRGHLLIIDGEGAEIYDVSPGPNGVFDGVAAAGGDDEVTHFDTAALGISDPEGIVVHPDTGNLFFLSQSSHKIAETTVDGTLVRYIDISGLNTVMAAGLGYGPASNGNASEMHFYIVDRGVDNNEVASENDGKLFEITFAGGAAPAITGLSPTSAAAGGAAFTLTVTGTNFTSGATVRWNGSDRTTTVVSATQLTASITASDIATAGTASVTVSTSDGASNSQSFTINNPVPSITSTTPAEADAGSAAFTLTVDGTGFVSGSTVRWNGSSRTTTYVSSTRLTCSITASDLATAATVEVSVINPTPGGGTSGVLSFAVNNPLPVTSSLSPSSMSAGGADFTLTVGGTGFVSGSAVRWNGTSRQTVYVSSTQLTASIPASDIAATGSAQVTVFNPAPGGGTSNAQAFTISAGEVPSITALSPSTATAGGTAFTLSVSGTGFKSDSVILWNGSDRTTSFNSSTLISTTISAQDIATAGSAQVTVYNPGIGTSNLATFAINNPAPSTSGISPASANAAGAAFTLAVNGTGFIAGSVVRWNGNDRATTYVSSTQLSAAIPAADIAAPGAAQVAVFSPAPGGGISNSQTFTIGPPLAPVITALSPSSATAGGSGFYLAVTGTNFVANSSVLWNGLARTTTYVSASQLTAAILPADIAAAGSAAVTVTTPGVGISNSQAFTINNPVPATGSLTPSSATAGGADFVLTIAGAGFVPTSVVRWNGANRTTTFVSSTRVTAAISAADIAAGQYVPVAVFNPAPGGGTSNVRTLTVNNPVPTTSSLSPASVLAGGAAFTLTVSGTGFVPTSVVRWSGSSRTTTFVSSTQLTAAISASDITASKTVTVTVYNAKPGGGTSNSQTFTVTAPPPTVTSLSTTTTYVRGATFTLNVNGTGFTTNSVIRWNGVDRATMYSSSTRVKMTVTTADLALTGPVSITVFAPAPGGGLSNAMVLTIVNPPVPTLSGLSPYYTSAGGASFTLTVSGSGFVTDSKVRWNGAERPTTVVSATRLTAAITAADIAAAGTAQVTVYTPAPGGGTSSSRNFTIR